MSGRGGSSGKSEGWDEDWFEGAVAVRHMLAWRGVEAQHIVSTMRLVDTPDEQLLLEQLLEGSKPALPSPARKAQQRQHYLLTTPFRYRPAHASRFRPPGARGQWYGAQTLLAACAEVAYWRHRFIIDSVGLLDQVLLTEHTFFQANVHGMSIDLMAEPWVQASALWTHGSDYTGTHAVAAAALARAVQWLRYASVRAPGEPCSVVFDPNCLAEPPAGLNQTMQTWHCKATRTSVMFNNGLESFLWDF